MITTEDKAAIIKQANIIKQELPRNLFTNETIHIPINLKGAWSIIGNIVGLKHLYDNIFEDMEGRKYYWNKYGFHSLLQYRVIKWEELQLRLEKVTTREQKVKAENKYLQVEKHKVNIDKQALIGKNRRKILRTIIDSTTLSDSDKLINIKEHILGND